LVSIIKFDSQQSMVMPLVANKKGGATSPQLGSANNGDEPRDGNIQPLAEGLVS
jgi:hypothetical protein